MTEVGARMVGESEGEEFGSKPSRGVREEGRKRAGRGDVVEVSGHRRGEGMCGMTQAGWRSFAGEGGGLFCTSGNWVGGERREDARRTCKRNFEVGKMERERTLRKVEGEDLGTEKSWGSGELPERMSAEKVEELQMAVRGGERDELGKEEELAG